MFSIPRATSPRASSRTLPCSAVSLCAISSELSTTRLRKASSNLVRRARETPPHSSNAAFAEATAASTSAAEARATFAVCSPVAGSNTGPVSPDDPVTV